MDPRRNVAFCEAEGCTAGVGMGDVYCPTHRREKMTEAFREMGIVGPSFYRVCDVCGKSRRFGEECSHCKAAARELLVTLDSDAFEGL